MPGIRDLCAVGSGWYDGIPIADLLEGLDPELRAHLITILNTRRVPVEAIVRACAEDGFLVNESSIHAWRAQA